MDQEVLDARAKLAAKYGKSTQVGGKGTSNDFSFRLIHSQHFIFWLESLSFAQVLREEAREYLKILLPRPPAMRTRRLLPPLGNLVSKADPPRDSPSHNCSILVCLAVQTLSDIEEVNMFKDDNTVIHFKRPQSKWPHSSRLTELTRDKSLLVNFSARDNLFAVGGNPETKNLKDMLPDILKQVGPQQYNALKDMVDAGATGTSAAAGGDDDPDDVPPLVDGTFESNAKWLEQTNRRTWETILSELSTPREIKQHCERRQAVHAQLACFQCAVRRFTYLAFNSSSQDK